MPHTPGLYFENTFHDLPYTLAFASSSIYSTFAEVIGEQKNHLSACHDNLLLCCCNKFYSVLVCVK